MNRDDPRDETARFGLSVARAADMTHSGPRPRPPRRSLSVADYVHGISSGDRAILGRALSLIESNLPSDEVLAQRVLEHILPATRRSLRVGITGTPGAGKSTFIEKLGTMLVERAHRVAVLAVDPTSSVSGGSILGDRTRMSRLSADPRAFIRPSPSGGTLGGVARKTRESILICEAAGFDIVLVETVGVGQSETAVADMTDVFVALAIPGAGDELQGIKRGLLELVDLIVVNKADGDNAPKARAAAAEYAAAARVMRHADHSSVTVHTCSALTGEGVWSVFEAIETRAAALRADGLLETRRREQDRRWLRDLLHERLDRLLISMPAVRDAMHQAEHDVLAGQATPVIAVERVILSLRDELRCASADDHRGTTP